MSTLVTGAAGASASFLLELLGSDLITTDLKQLNRPNHHILDLTDSTAVRNLISIIKPDRIFHLAGTFSNKYEIDYQANVLSTQILLESVRELGLECRVMLIGSAAEYGIIGPGENPVSENHPIRPTSIYGMTKAMQSMWMGYFHRCFKLNVVMARTFNLFGPGISRALLPGRLENEISRLKRGEIQTIEFGNLGGRRDFIHSRDAAETYLRIMEKGRVGEVYNVGSGRPELLRDFVEKRLAEVGLPPSVIREKGSGSLSENVLEIWADIRKLNSLG